MANRELLRPSKGLVAKIIILLVVGFGSGVTSFLAPYGAGLTAMVGVVLILLPIAQESYRAYREESLAAKANEKYQKEISSFLQGKFSIPLKVLVVGRSPQSRKDVYREFIQLNFPNVNQNLRDTLLLLCLCKQYQHSTIDERAETYSEVQNFIDVLGLHEVTTENKMAMSAFYSLFKDPNRVGSVEEIFANQPEEVVEQLRAEFIEKFSKNAAFYFMRSDLRQSEELRRTLIELVKNGELSAYGVTYDSIEKLKEQFRKRSLSRGAYLVLGNRFPQKLKDKLREFPNLGGFVAWSHIPNLSRTSSVGYVVRPSRYYESPGQFFEQELRPLLKDENKDIIIFISSLDVLNLESYAYPENMEFESAKMRDCYTTIKYVTNEYVEDAALWSAITDAKITTNQLLSVLPFNIFVPDLLKSEREFILRNYQGIRKQLSVEKLEDWANKTVEQIAITLSSFGKPVYTSSEANLRFGVQQLSGITKEMINSRLKRISESIVLNAGKYAKSMK
jgi:hypothetical protein